MPTSVLWVTLIAVWLFVVVPMVLRGRPQASKTTEAAANTRLVHRGGASRQSRSETRTRAAARAAANAGEQAEAAQRKAAEAKAAEAKAAEVKASEVKAAAAETDAAETDAAETDAVLDADLVEDVVTEAADADMVDADSDVADADVVDAEVVEAETIEPEVSEAQADDFVDIVSAAEMTDQIPVVDADEVVDLDQAQAARAADEFPHEEESEYEESEYEDDEYEDDLAAEDVDAADADADDTDADAGTDVIAERTPPPPPRELRGRGGYGPDRPAEREQIQYRERQRMVFGLVAVTIAAIASAFFIQPWGIIAAVVMVVACGTYLAVLRRTVRQERVRAAARAARRRRQDDQDARLASRQAEPTYVEPPARLRRPGGAIVLEIDDEDPAFDHLPTYDFAYAAGYDDEDDMYDDRGEPRFDRAAV